MGKVSRFYRLHKVPLSTRKEIDLRRELNSTFSGSVYEIPKAFSVLLRHFRKDNEENKIPCSCAQAKEGQRMPKCSVCDGEGWLWDEKRIDTFKVELGSDQEKSGASLITEMGRNNRKFCKFYINPQEELDLTQEDKIVELKLTRDGDIAKPERRTDVWLIQTINEKRSDNGRLEYIILYCRRYQ